MERTGQKNITVMFYNVENFFDYTDNPKTHDEEFLPNSEKEWDEEKYQNKIKRISTVIDSSIKGIALPDLIGFCEVENNRVLKDLALKSLLASKPYTSICSTGLDDRGINAAIMYDKNLFELITSRELNVIYPPEPHNKTRNILYVTLKFKNTDEQLHVFVNHWPSRHDGGELSEPRRLHAAKILREQVDELLKHDPGVKIIIMGDLNDTPKSKSVYTVLKAKPKPKKELGELLNPYYNFENKGDGTHINKGEWHVFDNIILSTSFLEKNGLNFKHNNAFILKKDFLIFKNYYTGATIPNPTFSGTKYFNGFSDHLAVYLILNY